MTIILFMMLLIIAILMFFFLYYQRALIERKEIAYVGAERKSFSFFEEENLRVKICCLNLKGVLWGIRIAFLIPAMLTLAVIEAELGGCAVSSLVKRAIDYAKLGFPHIPLLLSCILLFLTYPVRVQCKGGEIFLKGKKQQIKEYQVTEVFPNAQILYLNTEENHWILFPLELDVLSLIRFRHMDMEYLKEPFQKKEVALQNLMRNMQNKGARWAEISSLSKNLYLYGGVWFSLQIIILILLFQNG